ncbi:MAG: peptide chain release factor N(5)-glutamine methyltransferase [SAR86 cluster bacterium]|nr:peptide chain release factor N(5)-glutamine methyltransferase [SAR86 cluster bacterium]
MHSLSFENKFITRDFNFFLKNLGISDAMIALKDDLILSPNQSLKIENFFASYLSGIPIDYILNESSFLGFTFYVDPRVLIPRPETELIVEWVLESFPDKHFNVVEVGTGSGCISLSVGMHRPNFKIIASDISNSALEVAKINQANHQVENLTLVCSNWLSCIKANSIDLLISNPPYLKPNDSHLKDLTHEPRLALISENGSKSFVDIAQQSKIALKSGGKIIFEHGYEQALDVRNILADCGFKKITCKQDHQSLDRFTYAEK